MIKKCYNINSQPNRWSLCAYDEHREESPSIKRTECKLTTCGGDSKDSATEIDC